MTTDTDTTSASTLDALDVAVAITTRSIRDPAEGIYEYLEDRHEEQGLRLRCDLFPMRLAMWILRREGMVTKKYKRRFCVFDATHDELWIYRDDNTSGKVLRRLVVTRVDMTIDDGLGDLCITGYEPEKELFRDESAKIASRRVGSSRRFSSEQQKFFRPQYEQLRAVSVKASTVWSHCLRHHMKNYRRRKRMMRLAELQANEQWDLIGEELLDEDDEDEDEEDEVEPAFVYTETRNDPLDARRGRRAPAVELVFDGESGLRITKNCDFTSLAGVRATEAVRSRKAQRESRVSRVSSIKPGVPLLKLPSSIDTLLVSDHSSLGSDLTSIWNDEAMLACRVDFDSIKRTRLLSSGSFGEVWLAHYRGTYTVAVKCLKQTAERTRQHLRDFAREIRLLSALQHERIVSFVGVAWTMESDVQLLMEYMQYGDLRTYFAHLRLQHRSTGIDTGMWTPQQWRFAVDIIEGLVYLHSLDTPLVHCDLKSRNLLLDANVRVKIADFGIARFFVHAESDSENQSQSSGSASSGTPIVPKGTGRWLAPELLAGGTDVTPAVDVYAFGVVLTEIDTRELPYFQQTRTRDGEEMDESVLLHHIVTDGWTPKFSKTCPDEIHSIAIECMAFQPEDRPTSLDVAHRLRKAMAKAVGKG